MGTWEMMMSALKYPRASTFSITNDADCKALLLWLENTKIRQYKPEERAGLRDFSNPNYQQLLYKYLEDAECPMTVEGSSMEDIIRWLLAYAVDIDYNDNNPESLNKIGQNLQPPKIDKQANKKTLPPFQDLGTEEVQQYLVKLLQLLNVDHTSGSLPKQLEDALLVLGDQVLPLVSLTQSAKPAHGGAEAASVLSSLPLGFSTGDQQLDLAATVCRLLHVKKLRLLQTHIDHAIVALQEYTANPETDSSLGKVGR